MEFDRYGDAEAYRIGKQIERALEGRRPPELAELRFNTGTDNTGDPESNKKLSVDRAEAIKNMLVAGGMDGSRISTAGWGQEPPHRTDCHQDHIGSHSEGVDRCIRSLFAYCFYQWQAAS